MLHNPVSVSNLAGGTRRHYINGKEYLAAPVTLIVPGVLNGSKGPLYYPLDEIRRTAKAWNHKPITLGHPTRNGRPIHASTKGVLNQIGLGYVRHAKCDGKLQAEGWFDVERTQRIAPRVLDALAAGRPIELSTGLVVENEDRPGTYMGRRFDAVAINYRPDHLAILLDSQGACGVRDGCGVLVNFDPSQPRDKHGRWSSTGSSQFDEDWADYDAHTERVRTELGHDFQPSAADEMPDSWSTWSHQEKRDYLHGLHGSGHSVVKPLVEGAVGTVLGAGATLAGGWSGAALGGAIGQALGRSPGRKLGQWVGAYLGGSSGQRAAQRAAEKTGSAAAQAGAEIGSYGVDVAVLGHAGTKRKPKSKQVIKNHNQKETRMPRYRDVMFDDERPPLEMLPSYGLADLLAEEARPAVHNQTPGCGCHTNNRKSSKYPWTEWEPPLPSPMRDYPG